MADPVRMEVDRNGLEVLDRAECLRLLSGARLGRIGISAGALPHVLPVNFRLVGDQVVFRTGVGTKLDAATVNAVVAFEVDDMDALAHEGWSVVVTGMTREVVDPTELETLEVGRIPRWAPSGDGRVIAISCDLVSGRRLVQRRMPYEEVGP
jgi:nitroimidazol reductase NimA-like FMN-containing flavoprotein (pyridoxamine 5'-phosphate oxidase superfamily)